MISPLKGWQGWAILLAAAGVIDLLAGKDQTLSEASHRAVAKRPVLTTTFIALTAAHLAAGHYSSWRRIDPYAFVGQLRRYLWEKING